MTVDQHASRLVGDRVDALVSGFADLAGHAGMVRSFERTVGDEAQAVLDDHVLAVDVALRILRGGGWSVGIGVGPVDEPLPESARAGSGEAFVRARAAVERAKSRQRPVPVAVIGAGESAGECEAVLTLVGAVVGRRSAAGWAVVDAFASLGPAATQASVAGHLGISQQAVSQRLRAAMWYEELAVRPVAARLLRDSDR